MDSDTPRKLRTQKRRGNCAETTPKKKNCSSSVVSPGTPALRHPSSVVVDACSPSSRKEQAPAVDIYPDGLRRCHGSCSGPSERAERCIKYHDEEWGVPCTDDERLMEFLILDCAQCGLSWRTIFERRAAYAAAFKNWKIERIAAMTDADVEGLVQGDSGIIRHRGKIESAIHNAKVVTDVQQQHGSLASYLWGLMPDGKPISNSFKAWKDVPATTELAHSISKSLKQKGFKFVGPTMVYAFMQTIGMVNDHCVHCFRHAEVNKLHETFKTP